MQRKNNRVTCSSDVASDNVHCWHREDGVELMILSVEEHTDHTVQGILEGPDHQQTGAWGIKQ